MTTTEATESETEPHKLHDCRHVWQGDYPDERALHTPRGAAACAHDYVLGGLELIEDGDADDAADWALTAKLFLTGFLERCDGESLAIAGGVLPIDDQERGEFSEIADVLDEACQQGPDGLTRALQEAHRRLHDVFDTAGDVRLSGVKMPADAGASYRSPDEPAPQGGRPDPTVELSDALTRPKEELTLLELAVMEAPNRGEEFADMLKWRLHDTRRKLEEAQERATERLQARRGKLNGGEVRE